MTAVRDFTLTVVEAHQSVMSCVVHAVDEVVLRRVVRQVLERQHGQRPDRLRPRRSPSTPPCHRLTSSVPTTSRPTTATRDGRPEPPVRDVAAHCRALACRGRRRAGTGAGRAGRSSSARSCSSCLEVDGRLHAPARVLLEASLHDPREAGRERRLQLLERRRIVLENGGHHVGRRVSPERADAARHLVEDGAEGEEIGPGVDALAAALFGRHVGDRPHDLPGHRPRRAWWPRRRRPVTGRRPPSPGRSRGSSRDPRRSPSRCSA